jgi:hypothetical protein
VKKHGSLLEGPDFRYGGNMSKDGITGGEPSSENGNPAQSRDDRPPGPVKGTDAERRRMRAAEKLRENLARRKQQVRARRAGQADETDGLPAAKMDES